MNVTELWAAAVKRLNAMTPEERVQTLVDAGILTADGEVAEPYQKVVVNGMNVKKLKEFAATIKHSGDYGELWIHRKNSGVIWVAGDGDFEEEYGHSSWEYVEEGFEAIEGVKSVEIAAEWRPEEAAWICLGKFGEEPKEFIDYLETLK